MSNTQKTVTMKLPTVKNKAANTVQITAEQILKDAEMHRGEQLMQQDERIRDQDELNEIKMSKRKDFEKKVNQQRFYIGHWIKYATWEEQMQEYKRARSVYERALEVEYKNVGLWLKYIEMEMRHKFINHARNLFERAIDILPREEQFWFKYAYMEEVLQNYVKARMVFKRWMEWNPQERAWMAFLAFEQRMKEPENCRQVIYDFMENHPRLRTYLKVAKFEQKNKNYQAARSIYERCLEELGQESMKEEYFLTFSKFEINNKEYNRAREIFKFGLKSIPKDQCKNLYKEYLSFEKQYGQKDEIEEIILGQRRIHYKEQIAENPLNYDAWFDLVNLEISTKHTERIQSTFQEAVKNTPPVATKRLWKRYIYLWYSYATYEELDNENPENANKVYSKILQMVPHKEFTFSKLWIMYAHFQLRQQNLQKARQIFGEALGKCPREKILQEYIEMEIQLANIDRVRQIYQRYVELFPDNPTPWIKWAELERNLQEMERYRGLFELAINNSQLYMPETVWKAFIDNEIDEKEWDKVRELYERLLERTQHLKIWVSYAQFEQSIQEYEKCRAIFQRGEEFYKQKQDKQERALLLENWLEVEQSIGDRDQILSIKKKQPQRVIKKRKVVKQGEDLQEEEVGEEEYYDYVFPTDPESKGVLKMLEKAKAFKKKQMQAKEQLQQQ